MGLFESLYNKTEDENKVIASPFKFTAIEYSYDTFLKKIKDGEMSDFQIQQHILMHYDNYCNYDNFQNSTLRKTFQKIWSNEKFVQMFYCCTDQIKKDLKTYYNRFLCKIAYDYCSEKGENDAVTNYLFQIVRIVNIEEVLPLTQYMKDKDAIFLVICNKSSFENKECIERINKFLIYAGYDFSVRELIDIYLRLSRGEHFSPYFNYTMTLIMDELDQLQSAIYNRSSYAMLIIINSMPMEELIKLLIRYKEFFQYNPKAVSRFDIYQINSVEYDRISKALKEI